MKTSAVVSAVLGLVSSASAHYTFDKLLINDVQQGGANTYIRKHQNGYMPTKFNKTPAGSITPTDADFTCNKGAVPAPQVMTVKAGDKIGLKQAYGGTGMKHPGPGQVYMSPVGDAKTDKGSDWYKVHQDLLCSTAPTPDLLRTTAWCTWGEDNIHFTVPSTIPNGQYLVRGEHIGLHGAHDGQAEFYYACVQVEVTGNSATSMPGTSAKIPGVYKNADPPVNFSLWGKATSYPAAPGPDVIPGGTIRGSADGSTGDKTVTVAGGSQSSSSQGSGSSEAAPKPSSAPSSAAPAPAASSPAPAPVASSPASVAPAPVASSPAAKPVCKSKARKARK